MNEDLKKKKKTGLVRKGAVVPFLLFSSAIVVFNIFFLDSTIKNLGEHFGTKLNGAEVNIASVKTSFSKLSFEMNGIQFTDPENLDFNRFEIGKIHFAMLWDALLRAKIVVEDAQMKNITIGEKRKYKGYLLKVDPNAEPSAAQKSLLEAKEEFKGNIFGDLSALLSGTESKEQLTEIKGELKSQQRYQEIQKEVAQKEEQWKELVNNLPNDEKMDSLKSRAKAINFNDLGNLKKAKETLKEIKTVKNDASEMIKSFDRASDRFKADINYIKSSIKEADDLIKEDMKSLESRMNIPSLDAQSIGKVLFGAEFASKVAEVQRYMGMAKEYMPEKNSKEEIKAKKEAVKAHARGVGKNYQFGTPKTYPLFWVKLIDIDSKNQQGTMKGKVLDLTSDQATLNKTTIINLKGDFPAKEIRDISADINLDHRVILHEKAKIVIGSYPISEKKLSNSTDVTFNIKKAQARIEFDADIISNEVKFALDNTLTNVDYEIDAKSASMKSILNNVAQETPQIKILASATGPWKKLSWRVKTNLAESIKNGLNRHVKEKIDGMKKKLEESIKAKIAGDKSKITGKLDEIQNKYLGKISGGKSKANDLISGMDNDSKKANSPSAKVQDKGKEALKKLKSKFKF